MQSIQVFHATKIIQGSIKLGGSKSISNRVLLIRALSGEDFKIQNISDSDDTITMEKLLGSDAELYDAHHAGTTFRFLTAYLATKSGTQILTGSDRMKQRPIKVLVDALIELGADIEYLENDGYPPLKIKSPAREWKREIQLSADVSSQYISALLMIAPTLPNGLVIHLIGEIVSKPYIDMTIRIMSYFGADVYWEGSTIKVINQKYQTKDFFVEADWSSASYFYSIAGLSNSCDLSLYGLKDQSLQGDSIIAELGLKFGIETIFHDNYIQLIKKPNSVQKLHFEYDFINVPDIAQSMSVLCAGLGITGLFAGLKTLRIKETDRIAALQTELSKFQVWLSKMPAKFSKKSNVEYYLQEGKVNFINEDEPISIETYNDHRMAMSFATLGMVTTIIINEPMVVSKSYPHFWKDLQLLGFELLSQ